MTHRPRGATAINQKSAQHRLIDVTRVGPFATRRIYRLSDQSLLEWESRVHRKNLTSSHAGGEVARARRQLGIWLPRDLNWWIGVIFALGALLFMLGSLFSLVPSLAKAWALDAAQVNVMFFAGSIPFTTAAYLQLFQSANAPELPHQVASRQPQHRRPMVIIGWRPGDIGWLSCALQFMGTLLFNLNTFDAMRTDIDWLQQDLGIWVPDFVGSVLFLISGYLAFIETCHARFAWQPGNISWRITFANLLGCIAFMISAMFAFVLPGPAHPQAITISLGFTFVGAAGFLIASLLMLPETAAAADE